MQILEATPAAEKVATAILRLRAMLERNPAPEIREPLRQRVTELRLELARLCLAERDRGRVP